MNFGIVIRHDGKYVRLQVKQIYLSKQLERYEVTGKNKTLVLQSNRPLIRSKGMKTRKPDRKLIAGNLHNVSFLERLINTLENYLKNNERNNFGLI